MIKETLKDHAKNDKDAKKVLEENRKKREKSESESEASDAKSNESIFDKKVKQIIDVHQGIHKQIQALNRRNFKFHSRRLMAENTIDP